MNDELIATAVIAIMVALCIIPFLLIRAAGRRAIQKMLSGNLYEDYAKKYPDPVHEGKVTCFKCKAEKPWIQLVERAAHQNIPQHICRN